MIIVYNPQDGAPINGFICRGKQIDPHFPDGYEKKDGTLANGLMQYEDFVAAELLETFGFLTSLPPVEAKKILDRPPEAKYKCDFPNCEFSTHTKIALLGHKRTHAKDIASASQPVIDPDLIPIAGGQRVIPLAERKQMADNGGRGDIVNGPDQDGVDWYGEGATVENHSNDSFSQTKAAGKGHFVG